MTTTKHQGLHLDSDLSGDTRIEQVVKKASKRLAALARHSLPCKDLVPIYNGVISPRLEYDSGLLLRCNKSCTAEAPEADPPTTTETPISSEEEGTGRHSAVKEMIHAQQLLQLSHQGNMLALSCTPQTCYICTFHTYHINISTTRVVLRSDYMYMS